MNTKEKIHEMNIRKLNFRPRILFVSELNVS